MELEQLHGNEQTEQQRQRCRYDTGNEQREPHLAESLYKTRACRYAYNGYEYVQSHIVEHPQGTLGDCTHRRVVRSPPAEHQACNQCSATTAKADGYIAYMQRQGTYYRTDENTGRQVHDVCLVGCRVGVTYLPCGLHNLNLLAHKLNHITRVQYSLWKHRYAYSHALNLLYHHAMHHWLCAQFAHPFAVVCDLTACRLAGNRALYGQYRELQQLLILRLGANPSLLANGVFMAPAQYNLITHGQTLLGTYLVDYELALAYALHEQTLALALEELLKLPYRAPFPEPLVLNAVTAELHLTLCLGKARLLALVLAHALLKLTASTPHLVNATKHLRAQARKNPCRTRRAEYISHRIRNGDYVKHLLLLIIGQPHPAYGITSYANHSADGL